MALGLIDRIGTLESVYTKVEENSDVPDESGTVSVEELTGGTPVDAEVVEAAEAPVASEEPKAEDAPPAKEDEEEKAEGEEEEEEKEDEEGGEEEASAPPSADVSAAPSDVKILTDFLVAAGCPVDEVGIRASLTEKAINRKEMFADMHASQLSHPRMAALQSQRLMYHNRQQALKALTQRLALKPWSRS